MLAESSATQQGRKKGRVRRRSERCSAHRAFPTSNPHHLARTSVHARVLGSNKDPTPSPTLPYLRMYPPTKDCLDGRNDSRQRWYVVTSRAQCSIIELDLLCLGSRYPRSNKNLSPLPTLLYYGVAAYPGVSCSAQRPPRTAAHHPISNTFVQPRISLSRFKYPASNIQRGVNAIACTTLFKNIHTRLELTCWAKQPRARYTVPSSHSKFNPDLGSGIQRSTFNTLIQRSVSQPTFQYTGIRPDPSATGRHLLYPSNSSSLFLATARSL